ncbi:MAG: DinB family protein [Anaerolineales bacterium]|jgi:hypothetical protein
MEDTMEQLISRIQATQKRLVVLLETRADDQDWQPAPGEWSFRYIASHLATTEKECYQDRVVRIAAGGKPHFESYFNTGRDFSQNDLKDSLHAWTATRQEIIDFVRSLPEEKRSFTGTHAAFGTLTVQGVLRLMLDHDQEHIQDLEKMMGKYGTKPSTS